LPLIRDIAKKLGGLDPAEEPLPVRPAAHYTMGGIHVNIKTETPISGLYAAGECSCLSVHGANRLGGNSTTDCLVFGCVAGEEAAKYASSNSFRELPREKVFNEERRIFDEILGQRGDEKVSTIRDAMRKVLNENVWVFRTEEGLQSALKEIKHLRERFKNINIEDKTRTFNTQLIETLQLDFMLDLAEVTVVSALARTESRGAHYRLDHPNRDDKKWLVHTLAHYTKEGPKLEYLPVTITKWQPTARAY
jgi:succinate dehydrogenase / fumarate reductase flavoprotein subunit